MENAQGIGAQKDRVNKCKELSEHSETNWKMNTARGNTENNKSQACTKAAGHPMQYAKSESKL